MGEREIPSSYVYTCDFCAKDHIPENPRERYVKSTPPGWFTVTVIGGCEDGYHYTNNGCLLCEECGPPLVKTFKRP